MKRTFQPKNRQEKKDDTELLNRIKKKYGHLD